MLLELMLRAQSQHFEESGQMRPHDWGTAPQDPPDHALRVVLGGTSSHGSTGINHDNDPASTLSAHRPTL